MATVSQQQQQQQQQQHHHHVFGKQSNSCTSCSLSVSSKSLSLTSTTTLIDLHTGILQSIGFSHYKEIKEMNKIVNLPPIQRRQQPFHSLYRMEGYPGIGMTSAALPSQGQQHQQGASSWLCPHCCYRNNDSYHTTICAMCGRSPSGTPKTTLTTFPYRKPTTMQEAEEEGSTNCSVRTDPYPRQKGFPPPRFVAFDNHNSNINTTTSTWDDVVSLPSLPSNRSLLGSVGGSSSGLATHRSTATESVCSRTTARTGVTTQQASNTVQAHFWRTRGTGSNTTTTTNNNNNNNHTTNGYYSTTTYHHHSNGLHRQRREVSEQAGGTLQPPSVLHDSAIFHPRHNHHSNNNTEGMFLTDDADGASVDSASTFRRDNLSLMGGGSNHGSSSSSSCSTSMSRRKIPHEDPLEDDDQPRRLPTMAPIISRRNPLPQPCSPMVNPRRRPQEDKDASALLPTLPTLDRGEQGQDHLGHVSNEEQDHVSGSGCSEGQLPEPEESLQEGPLQEEVDQADKSLSPVDVEKEDNDEEITSPRAPTHKSVMKRMVKKLLFRRPKKTSQHNQVPVVAVVESTHPSSASSSGELCMPGSSHDGNDDGSSHDGDIAVATIVTATCTRNENSKDDDSSCISIYCNCNEDDDDDVSYPWTMDDRSFSMLGSSIITGEDDGQLSASSSLGERGGEEDDDDDDEGMSQPLPLLVWV